MKGNGEVGPFRKQVEKAVKEKDNALYKEIFKIVGDTMQGKNDHDKLWNQSILLYDQIKKDYGSFLFQIANCIDSHKSDQLSNSSNSQKSDRMKDNKGKSDVKNKKDKGKESKGKPSDQGRQ